MILLADMDKRVILNIVPVPLLVLICLPRCLAFCRAECLHQACEYPWKLVRFIYCIDLQTRIESIESHK